MSHGWKAGRIEFLEVAPSTRNRLIEFTSLATAVDRYGSVLSVAAASAGNRGVVAARIGMTAGVCFGSGTDLSPFTDNLDFACLDHFLDSLPLAVLGRDLTLFARAQPQRLASRQLNLQRSVARVENRFHVAVLPVLMNAKSTASGRIQGT